MKKWIAGIAAGALAWVGVKLAALGLVDPTAYNAVVSPEFVDGLAAFVALLVTGSVNAAIAFATGKLGTKLAAAVPVAAPVAAPAPAAPAPVADVVDVR